MPVAILQLLNLLTKPPGNLIYHLALAFSVAAALPPAFQTWKGGLQPNNRRVVLAMLPLLILRAALFLVGGLAWQGIFLEHSLIPALERGSAILSLSILLWVWVFPLPQKFADAAAFLFSLLVLTLTAFLTVWWYNQNLEGAFNGTLPDQISTFAALGISCVALILTLLRRPAGWGSGLIFFLVIAAGYLLHYLFPTPEEDYAGVVRLAELVAYPLLLILPQRLPIQLPAAEKTASTSGGTAEAALSAEDLQLIQICLNLPAEAAENRLGTALPRLAAQAMRADLCLLLSPPDDGWQITLHGGYDLIREQSVEGGMLDGSQTPALAAALRHGKALRLQADAATPDLANLAQAFHLSQAGHLLAVPVLDEKKNPLLGLVLLSPYSQHLWSSEEQDVLLSIARAIARFIASIQPKTPPQESLPADTTDVSPPQPIETSAEELSPQHSPPLTDTSTLQGELRLALEEIVRLRAELEESQAAQHRMQIRERSAEAGGVLAQMGMELRQPLASILGYTDFLLGESVGILGALQRKFLERIRIATQRMSAILDDYTPAMDAQGAQIQINPEATLLPPILEKVTAETAEQLQARNIRLEVHLPEDPPPVLADSGALEQILIKLVENAAAVSPPESCVTLSAEVKLDNGETGYLLLQVRDQGEGISGDDISKVFSRLRREPLPGVAESGANLYIVKTLVEALNGRIWIDSQPGEGAQFSMLFPLAANPLSIDDFNLEDEA